VGDLEALVGAAELEGPYVLVGASGGGFLTLGFAARHPAGVGGRVLVETPKAITVMPPALAEDIACDAPNNVEHRDYYTVEHAAWDNRAQIGDFLLTIISNDYGENAPAGDGQTNVADQQGCQRHRARGGGGDLNSRPLRPEA
jgi:pimeloyl-ACP methyl ester carboxylesterase